MQPRGGVATCSRAGGIFTCDLTLNGNGTSAFAWVIYDAAGGVCAAAGNVCSYGQDANGSAYCCETTQVGLVSVNIFGGNQPDTIRLQDTLHSRDLDGAGITAAVGGRQGNDLIYGSRATTATYVDSLSGDEQHDTIFGGPGGDRLWGWTGMDVLHGDDGADTIYGEGDDDDITGGGGVDHLYGGTENDKIRGGIGSDVIFGGDGDDGLSGGDDFDSISGGIGNDDICGDLGTSRVRASSTPVRLPAIAREVLRSGGPRVLWALLTGVFDVR